MRENQNIAHCSVCSEKTHCRFSHAYISHRLHSTESNFQLFLSQNLPNNMGDICMILIQNGRRFITHSPTISTIGGFWWTFGVPWCRWKREISRSCLIWTDWMHRYGSFYQSGSIWWLDSGEARTIKLNLFMLQVLRIVKRKWKN